MSDRSKHTMVIIILAALLLMALPIPSSIGEDGWEPDHVIRWGPDEGPIIVNETVEVPEDTRLVIEAGSMVQLDPDVGIKVRGHLQVEGTERKPVMFTTNSSDAVEPDQWDSVRLISESAGRQHTIDHAYFQGADIGLLVSATDATVQDCTFYKNRYGLLARGNAQVEVRNTKFIDNSVLGLEWETGADGLATNCEFTDNVVGLYCYEGSAPLIVDSVFNGNYHHLSFASGSNGTIRRCTLENAIAEAFECYNTSSPLFDDVTIVATDGEDAIHLRGGSRPKMLGGSSVSKLAVDALDNASYVVVLTRITVEVMDEKGKPLTEANVTLMGASETIFSEGATNAEGRLLGAMMSLYTVDDKGSLDRENPHSVLVEWKGNEQTFLVDPRDLNNKKVLTLEMDLSPPEPGDWGFIPNVLILIAVSVIAIMTAWLYQNRR